MQPEVKPCENLKRNKHNWIHIVMEYNMTGSNYISTDKTYEDILMKRIDISKEQKCENE